MTAPVMNLTSALRPVLYALGLLALGSLLLAACTAQPPLTPTVAAPAGPTTPPAEKPAAAAPAPAAKTGTAPASPGMQMGPGAMMGDAGRGKALYATQGCAACHGDSGQGGAGPALPGHTEDQVRKQVRVPRGTMPAYAPAQMGDQQIADIAAFIKTMPVQMAEAHGHEASDMEAPDGVHLHMALLAYKANSVPDGDHHLQHLVDFTKSAAMKQTGQQALVAAKAGKMHDAEHEIEESLPKAMGQDMTFGSMHLDLALGGLEVGAAADAEHHLEHIRQHGTPAEQQAAREAATKLQANDTAEAKELLAKALGRPH